MEEVIFEKELEYYSSSTGEKLKASVKIYPTRLVIEKKEELESILIPYINVLKLQRDPKWGYLIGGIITAFIAVILFLLPPIKKSFVFETPFKEIMGFFILIFAASLIVSWWLYRCFNLTINSFGYTVQISNRKEKPLREIYELLEDLRIRST
ncbi:hypothetical protein [Archaeoglobus sp.]